jgi:hypothetical protein
VELRADGEVMTLIELDASGREEFEQGLVEGMVAVEPRPSPEAIRSCVDRTIGVDGTTPLRYVQSVVATDSSLAAHSTEFGGALPGEPSKLIVLGQTSAALSRAEYHGVVGEIAQDGDWALIVVELDRDIRSDPEAWNTPSFDESALTLTDDSGNPVAVTPTVLCGDEF